MKSEIKFKWEENREYIRKYWQQSKFSVRLIDIQGSWYGDYATKHQEDSSHNNDDSEIKCINSTKCENQPLLEF